MLGEDRLRAVESKINEHIIECRESNKAKEAEMVQVREDLKEMKTFMQRRFDWLLLAVILMLISSTLGPERAWAFISRIIGAPQ